MPASTSDRSHWSVIGQTFAQQLDAAGLQRRFQERDEEPVLIRGERLLGGTSGEAPIPAVHAQVAGFEPHRGVSGGLCYEASQGLGELIGPGRLGQERVGAGTPCFGAAGLVGPADRVDRHRAPASQRSGERGAIEAREADVNDRCVDGVERQPVEGLLRGRFGQDPEPTIAERERHELAVLGVVIDEHDRRHPVLLARCQGASGTMVA